MTSVTNIVGSSPNGTTPSAGSLSSAQDTSAAATTKGNAVPVLTSRLVDDPLSGVVITQYLNTEGEIVSQVPPSAVVAYLQDGLTESGQDRNGPTPKQTTVA